MSKLSRPKIAQSDILKELQSNAVASVGNYILGKTIGEGSFGKVKLGWHKLTSQQVAVKIVDKTHAPAVVREIDGWRALRHPNIAQLYEVLTTESKIYMVTEFVPGGEAFDMILRRGRMDDRSLLAKRLFRQVVEAVKYCHDKNLVHRDLKLENVMLTDDMGNVKLIDFGFTREVALPTQKQLLDTYCGSVAYAAPEMIIGKQYLGPQADIWSLGVILFTLVCGFLPFDDDSENEILVQKKIKELDYEMPEFLSDTCKDLITRILKLDPADRIPLNDILHHPWFSDAGTGAAVSDADQSEVTYVSENRVPESVLEKSVEPQPSSVVPESTSTRKSTPPSQAPTIETSSRSPTSPSSSPATPDSSCISLSPREQHLAATLASLGFDVPSILRSVKHSACDQASALWFLLLDKQANPTLTPASEPKVDVSETMKGGAWSWARSFLEKEKDSGPALGTIGSLNRPRRKSNEKPSVAEEGSLKRVLPPQSPPKKPPLADLDHPAPVPVEMGEREPITRRGVLGAIRHPGSASRREGKEERQKSGALVIAEDEEEQEEETSSSQTPGGRERTPARELPTRGRSSSTHQPGAVSARGVFSARTGSEGVVRTGRFGIRGAAPAEVHTLNAVRGGVGSEEGKSWS
ncbi:Pkinase-domain-containing protein [Gonapodya prolifera JEL478]|uniref:Pkinase-domain-containing protein n=1 Tax=Gonapodya prolifera (strain JEL478) TaxID=1344416 RepID=A0A139A1B6_GONPJ|nr:Pkinase-domain-containing protein [Gonapodya prolifera JEL478]|eukprot:KXS10524.1 Pkinase-domain-containing protein [Gonapodya prolifera JEL478]